jgi:hypothetical protein
MVLKGKRRVLGLRSHEVRRKQPVRKLPSEHT